MINVKGDIELLKKDVWYLKNKAIPQLKEDMASIGGGSVDTTINSRVEALENTVKTLQTDLNTLSVEVDENNEGIVDISSHVAELGEKVEEIKTNVDNFSAEITALKETDELLSTSINEINDKIQTLQSTDAGIEQNVNYLGFEIANLIEKDNSIDSQISNLQTQIDELKTQIEEMGTAGGGGEVVDVIYDMRSEDPNVNLGFTAGMVGSKYITPDLTPYKKLRIFADLKGAEAMAEMDLINRENTNTSLIAIGTTAKILYYLRTFVLSTLARFQVSAYGVWTYSSSTSTLAVEYGSTREDIFVFRIEGIRK